MPSISTTNPPSTASISEPLLSETERSSGTQSSVAKQLTGISCDQSTSQSNTLKIEKKGVIYSPFAVKDSVLACLGHNLNRLKQGKVLYPVILKDDNAKAQFELEKNKLLTTYSNAADKISQQLDQLTHGKATDIKGVLQKHRQDAEQIRHSRPELYKRLLEGAKKLEETIKSGQELSTYASVLKQLKVSSNQSEHNLQQLSPDNNKLYVIGHGGAGSHALTPKINSTLAEGKTAYKLAEELEKAGLRKDFIDIRATACWSADSNRISSFNEAELSKASKPTTISKPWLFFWSTKTIERQSFAQEFSDSLGCLGFHSVKVTGYHGQGKTIPQGSHQTRVLPRPSEAPNSKRQTEPMSARSSSVKHVFTPNLTWEIKLSNYMGYLKDSMLNWFRSSNA